MSMDYLEFRVGTADLRRGLAAVVPHMATDREADDERKRVRLELLDESHADASVELLMLATDGFTAGCYSAEAVGAVTVGRAPLFLELTAQDITKVLAVFKADGQGEDGSTLRFKVTEKQTTIRDVSGLFEGYELELPTTTPGSFPDIGGVMARATMHTIVSPGRRGDRLQVARWVLERFAKSAKAVDRPPVLDRAGGVVLVHCGETFLGLVVPNRLGDDDHAQLDDRVRRWSHSLGELTDMVRARADQPVMFDPTAVDVSAFEARAAEQDQPVADEPDDPGPVTPDDDAGDPGAAEGAAVPTSWADDAVRAAVQETIAHGDPFSDAPDVVLPVNPFTDSAGNAWPTTDPFNP